MKMPERMPPMMITTVPRPHSASMMILGSALNGTGSLFGKSRLCAVQITRPIRHSPNKQPGKDAGKKQMRD